MGEHDHYEGALLEEMRSQFQAVTELVTSVASDVTTLKTDVAEIKEDIKSIKTTVRGEAHNLTRIDHQVGDHEDRLRSLEQAA